jgi:hypothetical protein
VRALRRGLIVVLCSLALIAAAHLVAVHAAGTIPGPHSGAASGSFDPQPARAPQVSLAAPIAVTGPTTIHAPAFTRAFPGRPALRQLPGALSALLIATRPARHLADTPLLI